MKTIVGLLVIGLFCSTVFADDSIGKIKTLSGSVVIQRDGSSIAPNLGDAIHAKDRIVTGADGQIGLLMDDDSRLSAGPHSLLSMEDFRFDPATRDGHLDMSIKQGTLSVIAGKMVEKSPGSLKVRTPAAILAVRGTEFSVKIDPLKSDSEEKGSTTCPGDNCFWPR